VSSVATRQVPEESNSAAAPVDGVVFVSTVLVSPVDVRTEPLVSSSSPQAASRPPRLTTPSAPRAWRRSILPLMGESVPDDPESLPRVASGRVSDVPRLGLRQGARRADGGHMASHDNPAADLLFAARATVAFGVVLTALLRVAGVA
jgi:hypothetical protein